MLNCLILSYVINLMALMGFYNPACSRKTNTSEERASILLLAYRDIEKNIHLF